MPKPFETISKNTTICRRTAHFSTYNHKIQMNCEKFKKLIDTLTLQNSFMQIRQTTSL